MKCCTSHNLVTDHVLATSGCSLVPALNCALVGTLNDKPVYAMDLLVLHFMEHCRLDYDSAFKEALLVSKKVLVLNLVASYGCFSREQVQEGASRLDTLIPLPDTRVSKAE